MMQHTNLRCLPENYNMRYYMYHYLSWPQLLYVQEDYNGNVAGYVLAKMDDEEDEKKAHGHVTSLSVLRTHRKLGVASNVMNTTMKNMDDVFGANYCSLHVRRTNEAALHLYQQTLGFRCCEVDEKYYVDDEDAFHMKKYFKPGHKEQLHVVTEEGTLVKIPKESKELTTSGAVPAPPAAPKTSSAVGKAKHQDPNDNGTDGAAAAPATKKDNAPAAKKGGGKKGSNA